MSDVLYRAVAPDVEIKPRSKGGDGRTLYGIMVPWNTPVEVRSEGITEQFAPGAFRHQERDAGRVKLAREHLNRGGVLIGRGLLLRNDAAGLYGETRVSPTVAGDETLALVTDGALNEWSVGFRERQNRRLPNGIVERVRAHLFEIAITMAGVYGELAAVSGVRSVIDDAGADAGTRNLDRARQIIAGLPTIRKA